MELKVKSLSLYLISALALNIYARSKLPVLTTKQEITNLRFISSNGKFTYYQRKSGSFILSTNYNVEESIKLNKNTHFQAKASNAKKWILVSANENFQTHYSLRNSLKIYKIPFGKSKSQLIGEGLEPQLHLGDEWASWFSPKEKRIKFLNLNKEGLQFSIPIANISNPYFIPRTLMLNNNQILFTDLNEKGFPGILLFEKNVKKIGLFQKFESPNLGIEFCKKNKKIYIMRYGLDSLEKSTTIREVNPEKLDYTKSKAIYSSDKNDIGQISCQVSTDSIFFIKNVSDQEGNLFYEVARLNTKSKEIKIISDVSFATQLLEMDGNLLLPHNGNYKVLLGENNMAQFDLLKTYSSSNKKEKDEK